MAEPHVTPAVRAVAAANGVNLSAVTGTGAGGRITVGDVRAAAGQSRQPAQAAARPVSAATTDSRHNPLVAMALQRDPARARAALARGSAPTLFHSGDLPPFTASGIDPATVLQVPWQARHAMAQAPTTAAAYEILSSYDGLDDAAAEAHAAVAHLGDGDALDYENRVEQWLNGPSVGGDSRATGNVG